MGIVKMNSIVLSGCSTLLELVLWTQFSKLREILSIRETGDEYTTSKRFIHRWNQVGFHQHLQDVAKSARGKASRQDVRILMNSEKHDLGLAVLPLEFPGDFDPTHLRRGYF